MKSSSTTSKPARIDRARGAAEPASLPEIPGWRIHKRIGGGETSEVLLASTIQSPESSPGAYVVKVLKRDRTKCVEAADCFRREAIAGSRVKSSHVVPILTANLSEPPHYIVMPYLPGASLAELLATGSRPSLPVALWIARQIAEGIDALQAAGWLHSDIKPSNVMVSPSGHVTLIDLGYAQQLDQSAQCTWIDRPLTGTLSYMAPELLTSRFRADVRSDLYSLAAMLYEMLSGRLPFGANDPGELVRQHREEQPIDIRISMPYIPVRVSRLLQTMLAKDPLRRPQTAEEVAERLTSLEIETFSQRSLPQDM